MKARIGGRHARQRGFTLPELLIVVTVLGVLSAGGALALSGFADASKSAECAAAAKTLSSAEDTAFSATGVYLSESALVDGRYLSEVVDEYDVQLGDSARAYTLVPVAACAAQSLVGVSTLVPPTSTTTTTTTLPPALTPPVVTSIVRTDDSPTNGSTARWTVTFSKSVTGVGSSDFALTLNGLGGSPVVTGVSGSASIFTVTASTGSGSGTIGVNLVDDDSIRDANGNRLGGTGLGNGNATGEAYVVDRTDPSVTVNQAAGQADPTNDTSVDFTVTFSEPVTGFAPNDLTIGGSAGGTKTGTITGAGPTYTVSVAGMTTNGTVTLSVGANRVDDAAGNGNDASTSTDNVITWDGIPPAVVSIDRASADPTLAASVAWTVIFSKAVTGVNAADFTLTANGLGGTPAITGVTGSATTYTVTASTGSGSGSLTLSLDDDDSISDALGSRLGGAGAGNGDFTGEEYTVDRTAPSVVSITRAGTSPTNASSNPQWTVVFSEPVTGVNSADFATVRTGLGGTPAITAVSGSATTYTVTASAGSGSGTLGVNLVDNDSIVDALGTRLGGTGAGNGNFTGEVYTIDRTAPTVTVNQASGQADPTNDTSVDFTVTFSEAVVGFVSTDVTIAGTAGGTKAATISGSGLSYTVSVSGMTTAGTVTLAIAANRVTDVAGNNNTASTSTDNSVAWDGVAPTVVSINRVTATPTLAASVQWTVIFSKAVTGVNAADFALSASGLGGTPAITGVAGSATTYTVTASTGSGSGSLTLLLDDDDSIVDALGNRLGGAGAGNGDFTGQAYTLDRTAPSVVSIARVGASPTNASSNLQWTVVFSESVTGVNSADFATVRTGLGGTPAVTGVTGSGTTYTVTASTGSGSGTLGLNLVDDDSIVDALTNRLGGTGTGNGNFTGEVYTVDRTAPTVTVNQAAGQADPTNDTSVEFTVTFSEPVTGFATNDLTIGGTAGGTKTGTITGSGPIYTVSVSGMTTNGTVTLAIGANRVTDAVGNNNTASTTTDNSVAWDGTAPTVVSLNRAGASSVVGTGPLSWTVTFSEAVRNVGVANFSLSTSGLTGTPTITSATPTGSAPATTWTVTASLAGVTGTNAGSVALTLASAGSIEDAVGNDLGGTVPTTGQAYTYDTTEPTVTNVALGNGNGTAAQGDTVTIVFSEAPKLSTLCSTWTTQANQTMNTNNQVVVTITDSGTNDVLTVTSNTCTFNLGSVTLGGNYVTTTRSFSGTGTNGRSSITWNATSNTLTITLGTANGGVSTGVAAASPTYTPLPSGVVTDAAGNSLTDPFTDPDATRF